MTQRQPRRPADPGEVRAPGRDADAPAPPRGRSGATPPIGRSPKLARAAISGLLVAAVVALALGSLRAILDIGPGLLVVAAVGGWLLGEAVTWGAWGSSVHLPRPAVFRLAAALGAVTWLAGSVVAYLLSLALLPESSRTFAERLSDQPFPAWLAPQLSPLDVAEIVVLIVVAWRSAR